MNGVSRPTIVIAGLFQDLRLKHGKTSLLCYNCRYAKSDVVISPLGLISEAEGGAAELAVVGERAAAADAGVGAVAVDRPLLGREVRVCAAGELVVVPIAAPLELVSVHVAQAPEVGGV